MVDLGRKPALVVVDMENSFFRDEGSMQKIGLDPGVLRHVIAPIQGILAAARKAGVPIFYTRECLQPDYSDGGLFVELFPAVKEVGGLVRGTWDVEILEELAPMPGEVIVEKSLYSAFPGTKLEGELRERGVDTLVFTGVTTECCVESTMRDAFARGFRIVVVSDAVAAFSRERHEATLNVVNFCFGVTPTAAEVEEAFARLPAPVAA
jgi:ureidoacrylate peracid hydrolase